MGTSQPSKGPGPNVPLVPPWVPPLPPDVPPAPPGEDDEDGPVPPVEPGEPVPPVEAVPPVAPRGRFGGARRALGDFAQNGNRAALERGLGHYVRKGLGGSPAGTRRMAGSAATAGALYNVLQAMAAGQTPAPDLNPAALRGQSPKTIGDRIIDAIRPSDGTQDAEANRQALANALSDMLQAFPNADLANLAVPEIECWVERFLGHSICHRIFLDIGKAIESKAPTTAVAVQRFEEMRDYVLATVAATAQTMKGQGRRWTTATAAQFAARVVRETLDIFEEFHR